jgi:hypothetical protein
MKAKPIQVTLMIDGKEKVFTRHFVKARIHRKALEMEKEFIEKEATILEALDARIALLCEAFDNEFTADQVEEGLNAIGIQDTWYDVINVGILGQPTREELEKREKLMGKYLQEQKKLQKKEKEE